MGLFFKLVKNRTGKRNQNEKNISKKFHHVSLKRSDSEHFIFHNHLVNNDLFSRVPN